MDAGANVPDVDDADLVAALRAGDRQARAELYDRYADRLFSYAVTLVRDRDTAGDVVHDGFLVAYERIDQLRDATRLRPWLYAVVRSEALRVLRQGRRVTVLDEAGDVMDTSTDLDAGLGAEEASALVTAALAGLGDKDREAIELALRHELDNGEIAAALGVSSSHASAVVSRAKSQFEKSLGAVVLMRTRGRSCADLDALLVDSDGTLNPLLRKRIVRHLGDCETCERERRGAVAALPGVAMAVPLLAAPVSLRERLVASASTPAAAEVAERAGRFDRDGFPRTTGGGRRRGPLVACVVAALVLLAGVGAIAIGSDGGSAPAADLRPVTPVSVLPTVTATPSATTAAASPTASRTSATAVASPTASATTGREPTRTPTPGRTPSRTRTPSAPADSVDPVTVSSVSWRDLAAGTCPATFSGAVTVTLGGGRPASVVATWSPVNGGSGSGGQVALTRQGGAWRGTLAGVPAQQENVLRVRVTTTAGAVTTSAAQDFSHICPQ